MKNWGKKKKVGNAYFLSAAGAFAASFAGAFAAGAVAGAFGASDFGAAGAADAAGAGVAGAAGFGGIVCVLNRSLMDSFGAPGKGAWTSVLNPMR